MNKDSDYGNFEKENSQMMFKGGTQKSTKDTKSSVYFHDTCFDKISMARLDSLFIKLSQFPQLIQEMKDIVFSRSPAKPAQPKPSNAGGSNAGGYGYTTDVPTTKPTTKPVIRPTTKPATTGSSGDSKPSGGSCSFSG